MDTYHDLMTSFHAERALFNALQAQKWYLKAKAERNHQIALSNDKLACMYERLTTEHANKLLDLCEKESGLRKLILAVSAR